MSNTYQPGPVPHDYQTLPVYTGDELRRVSIELDRIAASLDGMGVLLKDLDTRVSALESAP